MWYLSAAAAAAGAGFGYQQNKNQNQLIDNAAVENQRRINQAQLIARKNNLQQDQSASWQQAQVNAANQNNAYSDQISFQGGTTVANSKSLNQSLANNNAQAAIGTGARDENLQNQLIGYEQQKQDIRLNAYNQKQSDFSGIVNGGMQGLGLASQVSQGINSFNQEQVAQQRADMQDSIRDRITSIDNTNGPLSDELINNRNNYIDQLQALNSGIHPDLLTGPNAAVVLSPFAQQRQMYQSQARIMQNDLENSNLRYGFNQRMSRQYIAGPLSQMGQEFSQPYQTDPYVRWQTNTIFNGW